MTDADNQFLDRAKEAALWILERDSNPPEMIKHPHGWRFEAKGLLLQYQRAGDYISDDPWIRGNHTNKLKIECSEGIVAIARCPRHGGERRGRFIPTRRLSDLDRIGQLLGCTTCSSPDVVVLVVGANHTVRAVYCANCAHHIARIPSSKHSKEPLRYTEKYFREPTRRAMAEALAECAVDIECEQCVELVYWSAGGGCDTVPSLRVTYR